MTDTDKSLTLTVGRKPGDVKYTLGLISINIGFIISFGLYIWAFVFMIYNYRNVKLNGIKNTRGIGFNPANRYDVAMNLDPLTVTPAPSQTSQTQPNPVPGQEKTPPPPPPQ